MNRDKNNQDRKTYVENSTINGDSMITTITPKSERPLAEFINSVKNDTVKNVDFIIKNGVALPKNLSPVYVADEKMVNHYINTQMIGEANGNYHVNVLRENGTKTFSLNDKSKLSLIYNNGMLTKTPLFSPGDVGSLINNSIDSVASRKMAEYEKIARALRASEALDQGNIADIVTNIISSGEHYKGLSRTTERISTVLETSVDRDTMDAHIGRSFNDFVFEMKRQTSPSVISDRANIIGLRKSISANNIKIAEYKSQLPSSPNRGALNKLITSLASENAENESFIYKFEQKYGKGLSEQEVQRWSDHISNLQGESPVATQELIDDYSAYLSKRDTKVLSYFDKMTEAYDKADEVGEYAITEMINNAGVMNQSTHNLNPQNEKSYRDIKDRIRKSVVSNDGTISDEVLAHMEKGVDKLNYRDLTNSEKETAMSLIDDENLKKIVEASYVEYQADGNIKYKTLGFVGLRDTVYISPNRKHSAMIKGLLDIEDFNEEYIDTYMKDVDAYAIADRKQVESFKLDENLYADTLLTRVKHFKELQSNKEKAAIRAQFDAVSLHSTKESAPSFVKKPEREDVVLNPRVKSMIPEELADKIPKSLPAKSDIFNTLNTDENVFDILETVIKPLSKQDKDSNLKRLSEDAIVEFDLFRQVRKANGFNDDNIKNIDAMNDIIGAAYDGKNPYGGVYGKPAVAYKKSLEKLGFDTSTPFANLQEVDQLSVMNEIESEFVTSLSKTIDNIEYGLKGVTNNDEIKAIRNAISEQKSGVSTEIIEIENMYNGGLTKDPLEDIEENKKLLWEHDYNARSKIEEEREAMKKQRIVSDENSGNAISKVDKKDYQGLIAYAKSTSEIRYVKDIGKIGSHTGYLTYEEIKDGIVKNGDEYIPVEQFKQFHTMMDATQLMRSKPTGEYKDIEKYMFTPEEWKRGSVAIGNLEIPITQFKEYYDRDVRINRATWLRNNDNDLIGGVTLQPNYSNHSAPQEMPSINKVPKTHKKKKYPSAQNGLGGKEFGPTIYHVEPGTLKEPEMDTTPVELPKWLDDVDLSGDDAITKLKNTLIGITDDKIRKSPEFLDLRRMAMYLTRDNEGYGYELENRFDSRDFDPIVTTAEILKEKKRKQNKFIGTNAGVHKKGIALSLKYGFFDDVESATKAYPDPRYMRQTKDMGVKTTKKYAKLDDTAIKTYSPAVYEKIPVPHKKDTGFDIGYSQEDYHNIHKLSVLEDVLSNEDAKIVINKPVDKTLLKKLNMWHDSETSVVMKGSSIAKEIIGIDGDTVALKEKSAIASATKFKIKYTGEGTLFDALMRFDNIINTAGERDVRGKNIAEHVRDTNAVKSEVSHKEVVKELTRDRMKDVIRDETIDGKNVQITREFLLKTLMNDMVSVKDSAGDNHSIPRVVHDTALLNFPWMIVGDNNINDTLGAGFFAVSKALNAVDDNTIINAFSNHDVKLSELHTMDKKVAHSVISEAIGHKIKLELLFEYLGQDGSPKGDAADTAVRVAVKSLESRGIEPTIDNVTNALFKIKKSLPSMDSETKQYFSVIDKLVANNSEIAQKILDTPREVPIDLIEVINATNNSSNETIEFEDEYKKKIYELFNDGEQITDTVEDTIFKPLDIAPDMLDKKVDELALESDYYNTKSKKYLHHKEKLDLIGISELSKRDKVSEEQAAILMMKALDDFESNDIGKDLQGILSKKTIIGKGKNKREVTVKEHIIKDVLKSFTKQKMTLYNMNQAFEEALDKHMTDGIKTNAINKVSKLHALRVMNEEVPESAINYIKSKGGLAKAFVELGLASDGEVGDMEVIKQAIENMEFGSVEDVKNFALIQDLIPGLTLEVQTKDSNGNIIMGTLGRHKTYKGLTDSVITTTSGEKIKLVNTDTESLQIVKLNGFDSKDFMAANENVATKHLSKSIEAGTTSYNMVAGFSGNYNVMSRRPFGTGGVDPMTIIKNMSEFTSDISQTGLVFDFETTGLPNKLNDGVFSPIEFSYLAFDKKYRTKDGMLSASDNLSRIVTKYAKPNKDVKKFFADALENNTYGDLFSTSRGMVGKDDSAFMMLKNYAKYDNTDVSFGGKSYTWGSILTADMSIDKNNLGKVIAHIGDEEIHTNMNISQIITQTKRSGQDVFDYLSSGGAKGSDAKFGIDAKDIKTEKELVKLALNKMKSYNKLIGHNITTADLKWLRRWADRLGLEDVPDNLELKAIDTQDTLQAIEPGRNSNKLSNFSDDLASSHLAFADIETNIKLFNKIANSDAMGILSKEVNDGIKNGDYLVKIANQELGMSNIPKGRYQLESIENGLDGVSGILSLRNMATNTVEEYQAENLAIIKKELADNWLNFKDDGAGAIKHMDSIINDDASRTLYNAYGNPALVDRYLQYGNKKSFSISKAVMEDMHNAVFNATSEKDNKLPSTIELLGVANKEKNEVSDGVFQNRGVSDIERLILSNTSRLTDEDYIRELTYLSDNSPTRTKEFEQIVKYFDTDEGNLAREYLKKIYYREQAGIISTSQRQEYGDLLYQRVMDAKKEAVRANKLDGAEAVVEGKFVAGVLTKENLPESYRHLIGQKAAETFSDKELIIDMRNAEQTRRSIFSMGDDLARKVFYRSNTGITIEEARSKVVNEVILPMLKGYSNNEELVKSIEAYGTPNVNQDYKHAVNSLAAELSSRRTELTSNGGALYGKEYKTLATSKGVNKNTHPELYNQIEEEMKQTIDDIDYEASTTKRIVEGRLVEVPTPGGVEKIREIASIIEANEKTALNSIASLDTYKKAVGDGYDPIANNVNILPNFDFTHNNSGGLAILNKIDKISEWRITGDESTQWMTFHTADELLNLANNIQTHTDAYDIKNIIRAFQNKNIDADTANYYKSNFKNAINFIENRTKYSIDDIAGIAALNKATVEKISKEYLEQRKSDTYGNSAAKNTIMKELMTRANIRTDITALDGGLITKEMVANNPTKYNAMKALGLMQETSDGKAFYTGSIGGIDDFNNVYDPKGKSKMTLDPSKVLILGNEEMNINGSTINKGSIYSNQLAGVPMTHLTKEQLKHVADGAYTNKLQKANIESYLEKIEGIEKYDQDAVGRYDKYVGKVKNMEPTISLDTITNINKRIVNEHGNNQEARSTVHETINKHQKVKSIDPSKVVEDIKRITDNPLYTKFTDTMSDAKSQAKRILQGIEKSNLVKYGALGLGVGIGLKLVGNYSSSGRRKEESPNGGAPRVDGTYDKSYNNGERPSIGNQTVRLEENGKGLNISAKARNSNNSSDDEINNMLSSMFGTSFGSNVNIKYQDDRSVIDNSYVQNLVSNALFG